MKFIDRFFTAILLLCALASLSFARADRNTYIQTNNDRDIVLCTWNIAHYFAYGSAKNVIDGAIYEEKLKAFREIVHDSISADVISLNEFSSDFGRDTKGVLQQSAKVLLENYKTKYDGGATLKGVGHNAVFSKVKTKKFKKIVFEFIKTTRFKNSYDYYYLTSDVYIDGKKVKLVSVHLIYSKKDSGLVQGQISELIDRFKDEQRVVICGDFNTSNYSKFIKAGYSMANDGSIVTFPKTSKPLDNIVAKGVKISDVRTVKTELSDHYPLICRISI